MDYTLAEVYEKLKQLCDKMGSDYFVMPVFLNFFETATFDFVGEKLKHIELTQEVTDDIRTLIEIKNLVISPDPNFSSRYITAIPTDYLRLVAHDVSYLDGSLCRRSDLIRHSEYQHSKRNPNRTPTKSYPLIIQRSDTFQIDAGISIASIMVLTYCKKPSFATTNNTNTRIVNLPDDAIEKILKTTVTNLFNTTADQRVQSSAQLDESYRKTFR